MRLAGIKRIEKAPVLMKYGKGPSVVRSAFLLYLKQFF